MSIEVQKIACVNEAPFVARYKVKTKTASFDVSGNFLMGSTCTIDLSDTPLQEGDECWLEVDNTALATKPSSRPIIFRKNGKFANFMLAGTALYYEVRFADA
jgi:hypothetical protein